MKAVYVEHRQLEGWGRALPFYRFKCPIHGMVESYPQGYRSELWCPQCQEELANAITQET